MGLEGCFADAVDLDTRTVAVLRAVKRAQAVELLAWGPASTDSGLAPGAR